MNLSNAIPVSLKRTDDVVYIKKTEGEYTIIYGVHIITTNHRLIPKNIDGMFLETGSVQWGSNLDQSFGYLRNHIQYKDIFRQLEKERIPVFLSDINYLHGKFTVPLLDIAVLGAEMDLGSRLVKNALKTLQENKKLSGADLLKVAVGGAAGVWMLVPLLSEMGRVTAMLTGKGHHESAELQKLTYKLHPELFIFLKRLRDAVIAYKQQYLMEVSVNPLHFASVMGGAHTGLEVQIQSTQEEKLRTLQGFKSIIQKSVVPATFYTIPEMGFNGRKWKLNTIHEVPELKDFFSHNL